MASAFPIVSPASPLFTTTPADSPAFSAAAASSSKAGLRPDGPAYPSSFSPSGRSQHSRRPSRAERYEALVAQAREVLKRGSVGLEEIGLGFEKSLEKGEKGGQADGESVEPVDDREWRDAVRSLLKVVDGMSQQLSTHDELSKELKVAQSSLLLAESHSEFLEETLRRRDSRSSHAMGRHSSNGGPAPPLPRSRGTIDDVDGGNGGGMFGLGLSTEDSAANGSNGGAKSFFRLPSKRKPTPSTASIASTSTSNSMPPPNPHFAQTLRSVSSSPRLGDYSPTATSPSVPHPRFSTSTTASSFDDQLSPVVPGLANATDRSSPPSAADVFALRTHVSSLETECSALRSNNASLKRNNETLVGKCAELEKTKEDLMSELENLSVELFSEANTLVAEERRARAKAEEEVTRLRAEIDSLNSQLTILRQLIASRKASNAASIHSLDPTSPDLPALPASEPETPPMSMSSTPEPYSDSPARMPPSTTYAAGIERPASSVSVASTSSSGRKWFSFGRASSHSATADSLPPSTSGSAPAPLHGQKPIRSASHPAPSDSLRPPEMQRGDSNSSHFSDASSTSFFSFRSAQTSHTTGAVSGVSPDLGGRSSVEEERSRVAASGKGKEKARELDLGIYIPGAGPVSMAKTDSEGGRTVGLKTPVTADYTRDGGMRREPLPSPRGQTGRRDEKRDQLEYISSPPLPPLPPATPQISSPTVGSLPTSPTSSTAPLNTSTPAPSTASSTTPTFAPPTARPPRSGPTAPRPLAIHTSLTPPLSALGGQFPPLGPTAFGEVGGPRTGEMTAASKSPKSPNALRWTEVAGTLAGGEQGKDGRRPRSRSTSRVRAEGGSMRKEGLPPSPALPDGFKEQQQQQPLRPPPPVTARAPSPSPAPPTRPLPPTSASSAAVSPSVPGKLRIDTSSSTTTKPVPPVLVGGVKALVVGQGGPLSARPASPAVADPRPSLARAASSTGVPTSSSSSSFNPPSRSLASALPLAPPAGNGGAATFPTALSLPHSSSSATPSVPPALRPGFLRANSSASVISNGRPTGGGGGGMTPSTSASSIASTATAGTSSSTGTAGSSSRRGADGRPLSPDGTKAVEDLESLMASILAMDGEGVFGAEEGAKEGEKGEAK